MLRVPRRYNHFVFGIIQSGLTCAIAAAIASVPLLEHGTVLHDWLRSWLLSWLIAWLTMLPIVLLAAPAIRRLTDLVTADR
jgi:hypothetical protein